MCIRDRIINVDGVEWRRAKFSVNKRRLLKLFDALAQWGSHHVIYDNEGLRAFLTKSAKQKATCIAYPGDHVLHADNTVQCPGSALTICR
ncbi:DUF1972 domain-containing protein, partial [Enterobacter cloacae complex sp.6730661]|uniref:DUF1972 domain-containing protein n=1 Tax=Enterobacter cloacae complex sp.6730661 TaxID=3397169 RepID=UPI003AAE6F68